LSPFTRERSLVRTQPRPFVQFPCGDCGDIDTALNRVNKNEVTRTAFVALGSEASVGSIRARIATDRVGTVRFTAGE
jgi:hypothetical protein